MKHIIIWILKKFHKWPLTIVHNDKVKPQGKYRIGEQND